MFITFIRDDLKKFSLGGSYADAASWGIISAEGFGTIDHEISTEKLAVGDGDIITGSRIPSRTIDIVAVAKGSGNRFTERNNALAFFNPKHSFTVHVTRQDVARWIIARIERCKCQEVNGSNKVQLELALRCADPYFYSRDNFGKNIAAVKPTFGFPYISPLNKGFTAGIYNFAKKVEIFNSGDADTYFTICIEAFDQVINPRIIKDDVYIRLIDTLERRDTIEIDLVENTIKKNGVNCIGKIDRTSSFSEMKLTVGENTISFSADDGDTNMKVMLYYNLRYMGV